MRGRQAVLYDITNRLLDSRFLRNEEIIKAGESLRFDGHIVDIQELQDDKPPTETNVDGRNGYTQNTVQLKIHNEHLAGSEINKSSVAASCPNAVKANLTEWIVMYTTQVTQKAKKFDDGVLKLASCGPQGRQKTKRTPKVETGTRIVDASMDEWLQLAGCYSASVAPQAHGLVCSHVGLEVS